MRFGTAACVALFLGVRVGWTQELDPAAAEALFAAGRRAMAAGDYDSACAKFAESNRFEPAAGTLINLAECNDKRGKVATAWQKWREARQLLRPNDDRIWAVENKIAKIEERLPRLAIVLEPTAPPETKVYRDGVQLRSPSFGQALPIDPGVHEIRVEAPGHDPRRFSVEMAEGERASLSVMPGPELPPPPPPPTRAPPAVARWAAPAPAPVSEAETSIPWVGYIAGGVGVVTLTAGSVFGVLALNKKSEMEDHCEDRAGNLVCTRRGLDAAESGSVFATAANVGFLVGLVGIGAGAYLVLTHESEGATAVGATPAVGGATLSLSRGF